MNHRQMIIKAALLGACMYALGQGLVFGLLGLIGQQQSTSILGSGPGWLLLAALFGGVCGFISGGLIGLTVGASRVGIPAGIAIGAGFGMASFLLSSRLDPLTIILGMLTTAIGAATGGQMARHMRSTGQAVLLLALLLSVAPDQPARAMPAGQARCFPETGQCISGRIRSFWEDHGGLPVFGFPTGPQQAELVEGRSFQVQWFERTRLELHPEHAAPYDVLLGRLGADLLEQQGRPWAPPAQQEERAVPGWFPETGHAIAPEFRAFWQRYGLELGDAGVSFRESLALFGAPLSDATYELGSDGGVWLTQWFERARFEAHPNEPEPYQVLLGLLGAERALYAAPATGGHLSVIMNSQVALVNPETRLFRYVRPVGMPADSAIGNPAWAPDGSRLAFTTSEGLFVVQRDGTGLRHLTRQAGGTPAWSPDGTQIAYSTGLASQPGDIVSIPAQGGSPRTLSAGSATDQAPAWSPDSSQLLFVTRSGASHEQIAVVSADGGPAHQLTTNGGRDPAWAPDGSSIAFVGQRDGLDQIFVMRADGSQPQALTITPGSGRQPRWSPDGRWLAYLKGGYSYNSILVVMRADGSQPREIADGVQFAWSPASDQIAITSNERVGFFVTTVTRDGGQRRQVALGSVTAWLP